MSEPSTRSATIPRQQAARGLPRLSGPYVVLTALLIILLVLMNVLILSNSNKNLEHYYLAAGDSISFGYQPDLNFYSGFADDLESQFRQGELNSSTSHVHFTNILANFACPGESTTTMIDGDCPFRKFLKEPYVCPAQPTCGQLDAVVNFLVEHKGSVSPVTFELGANDVIADFNANTCTVSSGAATDLATMDGNLTRIDPAHPDDATDPNNGVLQRLVDALTVAPVPPLGPGRLAGDLVMLNYYNPYAKACPNSAAFIHTLNGHLAADAATFHIPIVDVYTAFGGDANTASKVCTLTWYCSNQDIHPQTAGYQVIATAVEATLGYPNPLPVPASQPSS